MAQLLKWPQTITVLIFPTTTESADLALVKIDESQNANRLDAEPETGSKDIVSKRSENCPFQRPQSHLMSSPANPSEYLHKPSFASNSDPWAIFLPLTVWVYLHSKFCVWPRKPYV